MKNTIAHEQLSKSKQQNSKWAFCQKGSVDSQSLLLLWYNVLFVISTER